MSICPLSARRGLETSAFPESAWPGSGCHLRKPGTLARGFRCGAVPLTDTVVSTLAVAVSWIAIALLVAGCGYATRRALSSLLTGPCEALNRADLWIGFATVLAFLQLWSLLGGISWAAWIPPLGVGLFGVAWNGRTFRRGRLPRRSIAVGVATSVAILWLANKALGKPADYDFGLYHLSIVDYVSRYAAIPGLGNLHTRLGAGDAHFLFVALLGRGPWSTAGFQLANGLLVSMLVVDVASRFVGPSVSHGPWSFTRRMALLLVPATMVTVGVGTDYRLSSPNIDLATFVLVAAGGLYLAECVEGGFAATPVLAATGSLASAAATRPLFWLPTLVAATVIILGRARASPSGAIAAAALAGALPSVLAVGWMARQAVLTGYPLYPLTIGGLPVNWRMPADIVHRMNQWVSAWARWPGRSPEEVPSSWRWLGHWLQDRRTDVDVAAALVLLAASLPALASRSPIDVRQRRERRAPMLAVLGLAVPTLVAWFLLAPDPRFALAPLWLVPVALVAWALPAVGDSGLGPRAPTIGLIVAGGVFAVLALGIAISLATTSILAPVLLLPVALAAWTVQRLRRSPSIQLLPGNLLATLSLASIVVAFAGFVAYAGGFSPVAADDGGPLGTLPVPTPAVEPFVTASGLRLSRPANGDDRCFGIPLCTPEPDARIRLLGNLVSEGFTRRR